MMLVGEFFLLFNTKTEHLRINQRLKKQHADSFCAFFLSNEIYVFFSLLPFLIH